MGVAYDMLTKMELILTNLYPLARRELQRCSERSERKNGARKIESKPPERKRCKSLRKDT
jgi:hypothetical protein